MLFSGSVHCSIDRASFSSGLCGILKGQWDRRSLFCQRDGLSRGAQFSGDLWKWTCSLCQKRAPKRGTNCITC